MAYTKAKYKLVCGVGRNDVSENIKSVINGKLVGCKMYRCWNNMLGRCYNPNVQRTRPNYIGCEVDKSWHVFSCFREWMQQQNWQGSHLDKDLLGNGTLYSKSTCVFVTPEVNNFLTDSNASRGSLPIGVDYNSGRFRALISDGGKRRHLGRFDTAEQAHSAWLTAKAKIALKLADLQQDEIVAAALRRFACRLTE